MSEYICKAPSVDLCVRGKCDYPDHFNERPAQEATPEPEYMVTQRWLQKLKECAWYQNAPGANLTVAREMLDHALAGCGLPYQPPVTPQELREIVAWVRVNHEHREDIAAKLERLADYLEPPHVK